MDVLNEFETFFIIRCVLDADRHLVDETDDVATVRHFVLDLDGLRGPWLTHDVIFRDWRTSSEFP